MKQANVTKKQKVFEFIVKFKKEHDGNSPTIREIGIACNITSTSVVDYYLNQLVEVVLIFREGKQNSIKVIGGCWIAPVVRKRDFMPARALDVAK